MNKNKLGLKIMTAIGVGLAPSLVLPITIVSCSKSEGTGTGGNDGDSSHGTSGNGSQGSGGNGSQGSGGTGTGGTGTKTELSCENVKLSFSNYSNLSSKHEFLFGDGISKIKNLIENNKAKWFDENGNAIVYKATFEFYNAYSGGDINKQFRFPDNPYTLLGKDVGGKRILTAEFCFSKKENNDEINDNAFNYWIPYVKNATNKNQWYWVDSIWDSDLTLEHGLGFIPNESFFTLDGGEEGSLSSPGIVCSNNKYFIIDGLADVNYKLETLNEYTSLGDYIYIYIYEEGKVIVNHDFNETSRKIICPYYGYSAYSPVFNCENQDDLGSFSLKNVGLIEE